MLSLARCSGPPGLQGSFSHVAHFWSPGTTWVKAIFHVIRALCVGDPIVFGVPNAQPKNKIKSGYLGAVVLAQTWMKGLHTLAVSWVPNSERGGNVKSGYITHAVSRLPSTNRGDNIGSDYLAMAVPCTRTWAM